MTDITVQELNEWRKSNKPHQLIDVREEYENETVCIQGAELIPMGEIPDHLDKIKTDIPVVLQCKSGGRSSNVTRYLEARGYTNVINLKGGIFAWIDEIEPTLSKY
jgi:sulfur-carrier protein adenylyltransferase/sulfurtransferase